MRNAREHSSQPRWNLADSTAITSNPPKEATKNDSPIVRSSLNLPPPQQGTITVESVFGAVIAGDWARLNELKAKLGTFKHPISQYDHMDILSRLAGVTHMAGSYPNVLTGVRICIEYGADPNANQGQPIITAARNDNWGKVVARLLEYGADPNLRKTPDWYSAIMGAAENNRVNNVEQLIRAGAKVNEECGPPDLAATALTLAVRASHVDVVQTLLKAGAKPNQKISTTGKTALHVAAECELMPEWSRASKPRQIEVVKLLLKHGADKRVKDKSGNTPLALAKKTKADHLYKLLTP